MLVSMLAVTTVAALRVRLALLRVCFRLREPRSLIMVVVGASVKPFSKCARLAALALGEEGNSVEARLAKWRSI